VFRAGVAGFLTEDGEGDAWVHRPQPAACHRRRPAVEAQGERPRPPLPAVASLWSGGWRRVGTGDRPSHPRHSQAGARPGRQVGMGRCQSRGGDKPTARPAVGDQATHWTRPRSCAAASDGVIAGAGLFPGTRRRNRGKTLGARRPSVARHRSQQRNRADRTRSRDGSSRTRREKTPRLMPPAESLSTMEPWPSLAPTSRE
jgi:hypothetical protein